MPCLHIDSKQCLHFPWVLRFMPTVQALVGPCLLVHHQLERAAVVGQQPARSIHLRVLQALAWKLAGPAVLHQVGAVY